MTTFPSPLVPTKQPRPVLPYPFKAEPDGGKQGFWIRKNGVVVGHVFPAVVRDLDGEWFGRHHGIDPQTRRPYVAVKFAGEVAALAYIAGCGCDEIDFKEGS